MLSFNNFPQASPCACQVSLLCNTYSWKLTCIQLHHLYAIWRVFFRYFVCNFILSTLLCSISLTCVSSNEVGSFEYRQQSKLYLWNVKDNCNCKFLDFCPFTHSCLDELCKVHVFEIKIGSLQWKNKGYDNMNQIQNIRLC